MSTENSNPDPRLNAFRPDLADERLRGVVAAERYVAAQTCSVSRPLARVMSRPSGDAAQDAEAIFGETVRVFEVVGEWAWCQLEGDGYVGYIEAGSLFAAGPVPTHRICVPQSLLFSRPDIKSRPLAPLYLNARITLTDEQDRFGELAGGGFVYLPHVCEQGAAGDFADFVTVAEQFVATPYLWGGKSRAGLDCSGLIQLAIEATGHECPRDSDMQMASLGEPCDRSEPTRGRRRGDLVFWSGHVGIMVDETKLLHANAHHMSTVIEPFSAALARIGAAGSDIIDIRRMRAI